MAGLLELLKRQRLTKPGLDYGDGQQEYFDNPQKQAVAFAQKRTVPTSTAAIPAQAIPSLDDLLGPSVPESYLPPTDMTDAAGNPMVMGPSGPRPEVSTVVDAYPNATVTPSMETQQALANPRFTEQTPGTEPRMFTPSFQSATTDEVGNTRPGFRGLTKFGALAAVIKAAAQGGSDALASGALDAVPGRSAFGAGFGAATTTLPILRRNMAFQQTRQGQELQQGDVALQTAKANLRLLPLRAAVQQRQLAHLDAQTQAQLDHAAYWRSAAGVKDQSTLQQLHAGAVQKAVAEGRDPLTDLEVAKYASAILSIERPGAIHAETPFSVWRVQNPDADVSDYFELGPAARAEYVPARRQPKTRTGTPGQFERANTQKDTALNKLNADFQWSPTAQTFSNRKTGESLTPDQFRQRKQRVQNSFEQNVQSLGGTADHYEFPSPAGQSGGKPQRSAATATAHNPKTGKLAYLIGGQWYTEDEVQ